MSFSVDDSERARYVLGVQRSLVVRSSRISELMLAVLSLLALPCLVCMAAGCSKARATKRGDGYETLVLRYQAYPTTVGFPELAEDLGYLAPLELQYLGSTISGPQQIQAVATKDADFGGAFNGAVVKLIASKAPLKAVIAYYGSDALTNMALYTLPDSPIRSAKDLLGKKVAVNTLGAHSEFVLREFLGRHGITGDQAKQVTMVVLPPANSEQALREKQVDATALQTILYDKAKERGDLRALFSDYELFGAFNAGSILMHQRFIEDNPNTVRKFVQATAKAIEWARNTPREQVIAQMERTMKRRNAGEDVSQLKYWKSPTVASTGGKLADRDFQVWIDWLVKDGQIAPGQVRARDLYTNEFQVGPSK